MLHHAEYFQFINDSLRKSSLFETLEYSEDLQNSDYEIDNLLTEFEMLFRKKKMPIYYLKLKKTMTEKKRFEKDIPTR